MDNTIATERKPIKLWINDIDDGALEQAEKSDKSAVYF